MWLWPVEYNAYGPANTRVILRPNGAKDYAIADHLGSVRLLLGDDGVIKEQRSYGPFGEDLISDGDGARTSYIGRENDHESNLGSFGVRHYDPTYGRFMSVDPLWAKYAPLQPYHYAGNEPVGRLDWDGREIIPINLTEEEKASVRKVIAKARSTNEPRLNALLDYAESSESTIHLYSMPPTREYGMWTFSRFRGNNEVLENRFYESEDQIGLTLQSLTMASSGQADVIVWSDVLGTASYLLLVTLLDELNHVKSEGIDAIAESRDHQSLFTYLLMLHDRGILVLPTAVYDTLKEKVRSTPRGADSQPGPSNEPAGGGESD